MDGPGELASAPSKVELWDRLSEQQSELFRTTLTEHGRSQARVEELERELSVWKVAFSAADEEKKSLKKEVSRLERSIRSLKDDNPLILCLVDGDGNIFSQDLITQGQSGGRQAAMLLTKGLTDYMANLDTGITGRGQVWLTVYCNKSGLLETLTSKNMCTAEQFEAFVLGFNQASPLFAIVDVGHGKEAADAKIKEILRIFTPFPQTSKVFFGGGHDNGYASTLNYLENEGFLDKIVLLQGYKDLAMQLKNLHLPCLEIEGVFMTQKLHSHPFKKQSIPSTVQPEDFEKFRTPFKAPSSPQKKANYLDPTQPFHKQNPPPCNFYYLSVCNQGVRCRYGHDYILTPENLLEMRANAKKSPCAAINKNQICPNGDNCCSGHFCPRGQKCGFLKQGKCKFIGKDMHIGLGARIGSTTRERNGRIPLASGSSSGTSMEDSASVMWNNVSSGGGSPLGWSDEGTSSPSKYDRMELPSSPSRYSQYEF